MLVQVGIVRVSCAFAAHCVQKSAVLLQHTVWKIVLGSAVHAQLTRLQLLLLAAPPDAFAHTVGGLGALVMV